MCLSNLLNHNTGHIQTDSLAILNMTAMTEVDTIHDVSTYQKYFARKGEHIIQRIINSTN